MEAREKFEAGIQVIKSYLRSEIREKNIKEESIDAWPDHSVDLPHKPKFIVRANGRICDFTVTREQVEDSNDGIDPSAKREADAIFDEAEIGMNASFGCKPRGAAADVPVIAAPKSRI